MALIGLLVAPGCEYFGFSTGSARPATQPGDVRDSARALYFQGMQELVDGNFERAIQLFNDVSRSPSYVHYAALARLRIGDALYFQDRYEEGIEVYRSFVGQYESDPNTPYARYRVAVGYFARLPEEWFLTVPAHEIDQSMTREAVRELRGFLDLFPTSRFATDARQMLVEAERMLFDHEVFVADYYERDDHFRAVAWRLDEAVRRYPEIGMTPDIVWRVCEAYSAAGDTADAVRSLGLYLDRFPDPPHVGDAQARLDALRAELEGGPPPEAVPPEAAPPEAPAPPKSDESDDSEDGEGGPEGADEPEPETSD